MSLLIKTTRRPTAIYTAILLLALIAGCSPEPASEAPVAPVAVVADVQNTLSKLRLALADKNYGSAAAQAKAAQTTFPNDPQVHLLAAEAEGHLGNAGNSAAAFQRAIDTGLAEPEKALAAAAFQDVRNTPPFDRIRSSLSRVEASRSPQLTASDRTDRIRAGDVEVGGDYVRAGDIVIDNRPQN
jgi:hypothetical protein